MRSGGNGSSSSAIERWKASQRADLDHARAPRDAPALAPADRPGGVARAAQRRLGELEAEALGHEQHAVEEPARQLDVVVHRHDPVGVSPVARALEQRVQVLELAAARRPVATVWARAAIGAAASSAPSANAHVGARCATAPRTARAMYGGAGRRE